LSYSKIKVEKKQESKVEEEKETLKTVPQVFSSFTNTLELKINQNRDNNNNKMRGRCDDT
jgi:hypothetical protein